MLQCIIIAAVLILDQVTKYLTNLYLPLGASHVVWAGVFEFSNVHNTGAAWGMFAGARWFFIVVTLLVVVLLVLLLVRERRALGLLARICLSLLIAGALGNLIDRVFLAYVREMFYVSLIHCPVFNVADSAVTIGAVLLVIDVLFGGTDSIFSVLEALEKKRKGKRAPAAPPEEPHA